MAFLNSKHKDLIKAVEYNELVIFAGAGISKSAGLPLWGELIEIIIESITNNSPDYGNALKAIYGNKSSKKNVFDVLNYIERHNQFHTIVNQVLIEEIYDKGNAIVVGDKELPLHSKLWQLSKRIITTNYDILFESCEEFKQLGILPISNKLSLQLTRISNSNEYLWKIHGNINEINDIVFYEKQYENQYKTETAVKNKLEELLVGKTMLFVGTSMTDPYLKEIIQLVNSIYNGTGARNFILSHADFDTAEMIKIQGHPINDLNSLLDELLGVKGVKYAAIIPTGLSRIKSIRDAIENFHNKAFQFPGYEEFENGSIPLNVPIYNYVKKRFENQEGPLLFQGRWATGKTVSVLRIGLELSKAGFSAYYLNLADDIAGQEETIIKDYLYKKLEKYNSPLNVFILDNVHIFPQHTYQIAQWAFKVKCNCIFVGRPLSIEYKDDNYYYPDLFERHDFDDNMRDEDEDALNNEETKERVITPVITFKPSAEYVRSIIQNKLDQLGRDDEIRISDVDRFAEAISYNLSFIAFHVSKFTARTVHLYSIDYESLYAFIDEKFHLTEFSDELFTIAALATLDCKTDCAAIFLGNNSRKELFKSKQQNLLPEKGNFIYGMHSATGRLIIDVGINRGIIRTSDNSICYTYNAALKFLLERYLLNKPLNIYEVFYGLSNYVHEAYEIGDEKTLEEARELIYYFLTHPELITHYAANIVNFTYSLLKLGYFIKTYYKLNIELSIFHKVINEETIILLVAKYIDHIKYWHGGNFNLNWHFNYTWKNLSKVDKSLGGLFIEQFPKESIVKYASNSIAGFTHIVQMTLHNELIDELMFKNQEEIVGDDITFKRKFMRVNELRLKFLMKSILKLSTGNFKNKNLLNTIKQYITPEEYTAHVKSLKRITVLSFEIAWRFFGSEYYDQLRSNFDNEFIYKLCFDKQLNRINRIFSLALWEKFLKRDFFRKVEISFVDEISTFLSKIALHGTQENLIEKLIYKLEEGNLKELIVDKLLNDDPENIFNFFWQLKTLDEQLFNVYFTNYTSKTENEFEPLKIDRIGTAFRFLILMYCYSYEADLRALLNQDDINSHIRKAIKSNTLADKVSLSALSRVFNVSTNIPYDAKSERIRAILFIKGQFQKMNEERDRFDIYESLFYWWESKMLLISASLIGINRLDKTVLKDQRFKTSLSEYKNDLDLFIEDLEKSINDYRSGFNNEIRLLQNKLSIFKIALEIFDEQLITETERPGVY